ncbi:hypothetical protein [Nocardioides daejeonensis]|uniref:hypothetical protein n=1 Tax=Nocardioides daejeonensis TaxID=1046556 RepID=UPI000D747E61|nr:hypothetical protein [Nocardioides daejeonensis]
MSSQFPRSTALTAGVAGLVALGALLGWGYLGDKDDDTRPAAGSSAEALPELPGDFQAIPAKELFATVASAQRAAGGWEVSSVAEMAGEKTPTTLQQVAITDNGADFRIEMTIDGTLVEGLWIDQVFYLQGFNPKKWAESWYRVPDDEAQQSQFATMVEASSAASLTAFGEPATYDVVGVEQVSELDDDVVEAVHYRVTVDPSSLSGQQGAAAGEAFTIDLWVDAEDRPVQVDSTLSSGGQDYRTTLFYSDYGKDFGLAAPARGDVTERTPPAMRRSAS